MNRANQRIIALSCMRLTIQISAIRLERKPIVGNECWSNMNWCSRVRDCTAS